MSETLSRSASGSLQRAMTNQGKIYLSAESSANVPATGVCLVLDGIVNAAQMAQVLNEKLIPKYDRFASTVPDDARGYYKLIRNFDCKQVLTEYRISRQQLASHPDLDIDLDRMHDSPLSVVEQYMAIHVSKYHNHLFEKRDRLPLWRGHLVIFEDLELTVFYQRSHHCICDGITLGDIFLSMADNFEEVLQSMRVKRDSLQSYKQWKRYQQRLQNSWLLWLENILSIVFVFLFRFIWYAMRTTFCRKEPVSVLKPKTTSVRKSFAVLMDKITLKKINTARYQFSNNNENGKVTFNDFMISIIGEALHRFLLRVQAKKAIAVPPEIGVLIPINTRDALSEHITFGNKVGLLNVRLPFAINEARKKRYGGAFKARLFDIKSQMDYIKANLFGVMSTKVLNAMGFLPKWSVSYWLNNVASSAVISNVAGPNQKLVLCGEELVHCFGVVQNHNSIALSFCVVTYNGLTSISCYADSNINGDGTAHDIMQCIRSVLVEHKCL